MNSNEMSIRKYQKKGFGNVEFLAIKDEIDPLILKGFTAIGIYRYFIDKNRISISYHTFLRYFKKYMIPTSPQKVVNSETKTNIKKLKLGVSESSFKHTNLPDQNELAGIGEEN